MATEKKEDDDEQEEETFKEWVESKLNEMFVQSLPMDAIKVFIILIWFRYINLTLGSTTYIHVYCWRGRPDLCSFSVCLLYISW